MLARIDRTLERAEGGAERVGHLAVKLCHAGSAPFKCVLHRNFKVRFGLEVNNPVPWVVPMGTQPRQHDGSGGGGGGGGGGGAASSGSPAQVVVPAAASAPERGCPSAARRPLARRSPRRAARGRWGRLLHGKPWRMQRTHS
jgi:hypothetical protein